MSVNRTNGMTPTISRKKSLLDSKKMNKVSQNSIQSKRKSNKMNSNIVSKKRKIKIDYNSSNYLYNDEDDEYDDYPYNKMNYLGKTQIKEGYSNKTNDNYITVEHEDGHIKYIRKNYVEFKPIYKNKNYEFFQEDEDFENNDNNNKRTENMQYKNLEDYDQEIIPKESKRKPYKKINNFYMSQNSNNKMKKNNNQNIISKAASHQISNKQVKRKTRLSGGSVQNIGNHITTTNNTFNNNIYYISPLNVKNNSKNKKESMTNKIRKTNNINKKNPIYKNLDMTVNKRASIMEKYFKINNGKDQYQREKYIKSVILIQSIFRAYLVKIKVCNNLNLYIGCKKTFELCEALILKRKEHFWKLFIAFISHIIYDNIIGSKVNLKDLKKILNNNIKEKNNINSLHKELGDSFNIIINNTLKENQEKKLKSKLNDVIKENNELKNKLIDNKNIEEKMKNLMDENIRNKSINDIIIKDNQQLAKKLKDIQDYRNIRLIKENTQSIDLTQKQKIQIEELIQTNEIYLNKLKKIYLEKIIYNKINKRKNILKNYFNKFRNGVIDIKNKEKENNVEKEKFLMILFEKINKSIQLAKQKNFLNLYYYGIIYNYQRIFNNKLQISYMKNIIYKKIHEMKMTLCKTFFKYYSRIIKYDSEEKMKEEEEEEKQNNDISKGILLKKIFRKYCKDKLSSFKIVIDKWNLKSKIIGIKDAARDKKKRRKQKKKNNKLLFQKQNGFMDKGQNFYNNHGFSHTASNGNDNFRYNKISTSQDKETKNNNLNKKNDRMMKKNNSLSEIKMQNNIKNDNKDTNNENANENDDSDEDSGDTFGLDNNSDKE